MSGAASRIEWVLDTCRLLSSIAAEFDRTRPFDGMTIGTGIHLEPNTVALLLTLARAWSPPATCQAPSRTRSPFCAPAVSR